MVTTANLGRLWCLGLCAFSFTIFGGCAVSQRADDELRQRCVGISNGGIRWDGNDIGVWPWIEGANEQWVLNTPLDPKPLLLDALEDPKRWVAAHVLLTKRWSLETGQSYKCGAEAYNDLRVSLFADGSVTIEASEQAKIRKKWHDIVGVPERAVQEKP